MELSGLGLLWTVKFGFYFFIVSSLDSNSSKRCSWRSICNNHLDDIISLRSSSFCCQGMCASRSMKRALGVVNIDWQDFSDALVVEVDAVVFAVERFWYCCCRDSPGVNGIFAWVRSWDSTAGVVPLLGSERCADSRDKLESGRESLSVADGSFSDGFQLSEDAASSSINWRFAMTFELT